MQVINISRATLNDLDRLIAIKVQSFQEEVELYGFGPPNYDSLDSMQDTLKAPNCDYYKILDSDRIIGGFSIWDLSDGHYEIGSIYVSLEYQDRGIGSQAMNFIFSNYKNVTKWSLETPYRSFRNHHFYEKQGFVKVGEYKPYDNHNEFVLFKYEKEI